MGYLRIVGCLVLLLALVPSAESRHLNLFQGVRELMESSKGFDGSARAVPNAGLRRKERMMRREYESKRVSPGGPDPQHHAIPSS